MELGEQKQYDHVGVDIKWYTPITWQTGSLKLPAAYLKKNNVLDCILGKEIEFNETDHHFTTNLLKPVK